MERKKEDELKFSEQEEFEFALAKEQELKKTSLSSLTPKSQNGFFKGLWESLKKPEELSREGLGMLSKMIPQSEPTGNTFRDIALNTPRIMGETLAEVAPSFVSRGSLAASGALGGAKLASPMIRSLGSKIGSTAEKLSGLGYETPNVLSETVKDPSLLFAKGKESARELYKTISDPKSIRPYLQEPMTHKEFVDTALGMVKEGSISHEEALQARKSLDRIKSTLTNAGYKRTREIFDSIAKEKFAEADKAYQRAVKAEALREFLPRNKYGTPSLVKMGIGTMTGILPSAPFLSPVAQGGIAAGIGVGGKAISPFANYPLSGTLTSPIMSLFPKIKQEGQ